MAGIKRHFSHFTLTEYYQWHYCDYMIVSIRESKARLSELVGKAEAGEEIMITVRGRPAARIVGIPRAVREVEMRSWAKERHAALKQTFSGSASDSSSDILNELRSERY